MRRVKVESIEQLRLMARHPIDIDVLLESAGEGALVSSKRIQYQRSGSGRHWWLYEAISGAERYYTERQLMQETSIVRAIEKGAVYVQLTHDEWEIS